MTEGNRFPHGLVGAGGKACGFLSIICWTSCCSRTSTSCLISTLRLTSIGLSGGLTVTQPGSGNRP